MAMLNTITRLKCYQASRACPILIQGLWTGIDAPTADCRAAEKSVQQYVTRAILCVLSYFIKHSGLKAAKLFAA